MIVWPREEQRGKGSRKSALFCAPFYKIINELSDTEIVDGARDYRMMSRQMVDAVIQDSEYNRFSKGIFSWVGFHTKWLAYENVERSAGERSGLSGSFSSIPSKVFWLIRRFRFICLPSWGFSCVGCRSLHWFLLLSVRCFMGIRRLGGLRWSALLRCWAV